MRSKSSIGSRLGENLRMIDVFGAPFNMLIDDKTMKVRSNMGALCSFMMVFVIAIYAYSKLFVLM